MKGFTLIEILVAVGIAMLIVGGVIVNYNAYNDTQNVKQAAQTLKNNLRFAQAQALAGRKPTSGCTTLIGFTVTFASGSYTIQAQCTEGSAGEVITTTLPSVIAFSPVPTAVTFQTLRGSIGVAAVTITLAGTTKSYQIQVSENGDMTDVGFQ